MNYLKLFEKFIEKIKLYRGDSTKINKFDINKFDPRAIYGTGLYLTDNKDIAYTYTTKGDDSSVIFHINSSETLDEATDQFIICYLLNKVNDFNFDDDELYTAWNLFNREKSYLGDMVKRYKDGDKFFMYNLDYVNAMSEIDKQEYLDTRYHDDKTKIENDITMLSRYHRKYNYLIKKTTDVFNSTRDKYVFIPLSGGEYWKVVDTSKNNGYVSEFEIDRSTIDKMYDANSIITPEIENIIKLLLTRYRKSDKMIGYKYPKDLTYTQTKKNAIYGGMPYTLANFLYNNSILRSTNHHIDAKEWHFFHKKMKELGYLGIRYDGGEHLDTNIKHNAYVIWDMENLVRLL